MVSIEEKERLAEKEFKDWLDANDTPYWYIQQDRESFSPALKKYMTKRPDFLILVPRMNFILTDVKYKEPARKFNDFQISIKESNQYRQLQQHFNLQVWYVFGSSIDHFTTWHWVPVLKVLEEGEKRKGGYLSFPVSKCLQISKNDNLQRLFAEMHRFF